MLKFKKLSPFTVIVFLFVSVFATTALVQTRQLLQKKAAIEANDIDVTYISRDPKYDYVGSKKWPSLNELVTFTVHIRNVGLDNVSSFSYVWKLDGVPVKQGSLTPNMANLETTTTFQWNWTHQTVDNRIQGSHTIEFFADPNNQVQELSETNNSIKDFTQALSIGFWVEQTVYNYFSQNQLSYCQDKSCAGSNSWEDWAQRQIKLFNSHLTNSKSSWFPQGAIDRVRLDKIVVSPDCTLLNGAVPVYPSERTLDTDWGFLSSQVEPVAGCVRDQNEGNKRIYKTNSDLQNLDYPLIHELSHSRYLVDTYALDIEADDVLVQENGQPIVNTPLLPVLWYDIVYVNKEQGIMSGNYSLGYDPFSIGILNRIAGFRNYFDGNGFNPQYYNDLPQTTQFQFLTSNGQPIQYATIQIFIPEVKNDEYLGQSFSGSADITGITDKQGILILPTNIVFSEYNRRWLHLGIFLYRIQFGTQITYGFQEITDLYLAYWTGQTEIALIPIKTKLSNSLTVSSTPIPTQILPTKTPTPTIKPSAAPTPIPTLPSGSNTIKVKVTGAANGGVFPNLQFFVNHAVGSSVAVGTPLITWVTSGGLQEFTYNFSYPGTITKIDLVTTNNSSNPNDITLSSVILNNKTLYPWGATCFFDTGSSNLAFDGVTTTSYCNNKILSNGSFRLTGF